MAEKVLICSFHFYFQHPLIPPYGTPVPYPAMYPPGAVYAHPSMTTVSHPFSLNLSEEKCEFFVLFSYTR